MRHDASCIFAIVLLLSPLSLAQAQVSPGQSAAELELTELLKVRAVTGARHDQRLIDSPRQIAVVTAEDIRRRNYRSTPEALADIVGVFVQETNDGGGSPIIRGLVGNQILILVDGIRLNNSAYRLGPNQYLNTIDLNQIERIEVVRGAGSVLYGSDALGGVVNIITRAAGREDGTGAVGMRWFSRLSSANTGAIGRAEVSFETGAVGFVGGLTVKTLRRAARRPRHRCATADRLRRMGRRREGGVPAGRPSGTDRRRATRHAAPRPAVRCHHGRDGFEVGVESRDARARLRSLQSPVSYPDRWSRLSVTVSYQQQTEHYQRIAAAAPTLELRHFDQTRSLGANVQFTSPVGPRHLLTYGVDTYGDRIASQREDVSLTTGASVLARGNFADGARYRSVAVFLQDEIDVSPRLHVNLGTRYSSFHPHAIVSRSEYRARCSSIPSSAR